MMATIPFQLIAAVDEHFGIGKDGSMPWHLTGDLRHFSHITRQTEKEHQRNAVIMGRKTWEALPPAFRPLPGRINCVLTRQAGLSLKDNVHRSSDLDAALVELSQKYPAVLNAIFVIGGAQVYQTAIHHPGCRRIYLTRIQADFHCDSFFPKDLSAYTLRTQSAIQIENNHRYVFEEYERTKDPNV